MLGLMRQESTYQNAALSPVGAIGLIQVMPGTGAKLAAMLGEPRYSPRQLEDPVTNLRYGIFYFGKLLERFDGVFPFAVASYNGGPHNMSRWYRSSVGKIETDQMVEMIEYDETRDYVKRVTGNYARYVEIYEPGARVLLPPRPLGDDPSVVDF
jgi:soluble lytic murein transglycosylase